MGAKIKYKLNAHSGTFEVTRAMPILTAERGKVPEKPPHPFAKAVLSVEGVTKFCTMDGHGYVAKISKASIFEWADIERRLVRALTKFFGTDMEPVSGPADKRTEPKRRHKPLTVEQYGHMLRTVIWNHYRLHIEGNAGDSILRTNLLSAISALVEFAPDFLGKKGSTVWARRVASYVERFGRTWPVGFSDQNWADLLAIYRVSVRSLGRMDVSPDRMAGAYALKLNRTLGASLL